MFCVKVSMRILSQVSSQSMTPSFSSVMVLPSYSMTVGGVTCSIGGGVSGVVRTTHTIKHTKKIIAVAVKIFARVLISYPPKIFAAPSRCGVC